MLANNWPCWSVKYLASHNSTTNVDFSANCDKTTIDSVESYVMLVMNLKWLMTMYFYIYIIHILCAYILTIIQRYKCI